jgi:hypothetical protein
MIIVFFLQQPTIHVLSTLLSSIYVSIFNHILFLLIMQILLIFINYYLNYYSNGLMIWIEMGLFEKGPNEIS